MRKDLRVDLGDGAELRAFTSENMEELFAVVDSERERLLEWLPWVDLVHSVDDERTWLATVQEHERDLEGNGIFVRGRIAGGIGLFGVDPFGVAGEIGYWLAAAYEGRGLITLACRALIDLGFGQMGLHRIYIRAAVENARSRAVPERLGFTEEGIHRQEGKGRGGFQDLVVYGLLEDEWLPAT